MSNIVDIANRQKPVHYTVRITHHFDGRVECFVQDVSDDMRSQRAVTDALHRIVEHRLNRRVGAAGDAMLAVMLANIDHAMSTTDENPATFKVTPSELRAWADAVVEYETARFPIFDD